MSEKREGYTFLYGKCPIDAGPTCKYYPCHFEGQDCTWCYCPLYPCYSPETGGKMVSSRRTGEYVWSCRDCYWVHIKEAAEKLKRMILEADRLPDETQLKDLLSIHEEYERRNHDDEG
jgi:Zn-finger protein